MMVIKLKEELVSTLAKYNLVKGIGQTGDMNVQLIPGKSDIDYIANGSESRRFVGIWRYFVCRWY